MRELEKESIRRAIVRFFAGYRHPRVVALVEDVAHTVDLDRMLVTSVVNDMIREGFISSRATQLLIGSSQLTGHQCPKTPGRFGA